LNASSALIRSATVARVRIWLATACGLSVLIATLLPAQLSDEEKRKEVLKARQEAQPESSAAADESPSPSAKPKSSKHKAKKSPSPTPRKSPTPKSKSKKHKAAAEDEATPKAKAKPSETPEADSTPSRKTAAKKKKSASKKEATPGKKKTTPKSKASPQQDEESQSEKSREAVKAASPRPSETPVTRPTAPLPRAVGLPTPAAPPAPTSLGADTTSEEPAELTIEKTGEKQPGFWYRFFHGSGGSSSGGGAGYRYLTRSVRSEIDRAPVTKGRWQFIVVHNSGTRQGNARVFDYYHRHVRHMQNGLAYQFVIGNGTSTGNGAIEIGDRWRRQINGGHVHSDNLNNIGLGICLVGDFNRGQPSRAQLESCEELIRYLRQRCGKTGNHYAVVKPHREVNPPRWATDCPGDAFPYSWFRRFQE
jgi:N-acetylmuramoyl-L-alanine amidase